MDIIKAIHNLRPNTEWTLNDNDVENMVWHTPNIEPLTFAEVENEAKRIESETLTSKAAAQAKLEALGLTADDLKALGL